MNDHPADDRRPDPATSVPVLDLELTLDRSAAQVEEALVLARVHGVPVGAVHLHADEVGRTTPRPVLDRTLEELGPSVRQHLEEDGWSGADLPEDLTDALVAAKDRPCRVRPVVRASATVTVVICTLGEEPRLVRTVDSVLRQVDVDDLELVVVDNRPETGRVRELLGPVEDARLRVVAQPKRGLSAARNAGVRAARGEVVAFTDDDAFADPRWICRLVEPLVHGDDVVCTTGLVLPSELETRAQLLFEEFGAFDKGFERTVWSAEGVQAPEGLGRPGERGALFPYSAGVFGSGNNMAFRRSWLLRHPFDEALGAGTLTRGGEDLDAYLTVVLEGALLVYEPAAVVWHAARREMHALESQLYGYGSGMAAVIVKHALRPRRALAVARRLPGGLRKLLDPGSEKNERRTEEFPPELSRIELRGYLGGPALYARSRWRDRAHERAARRAGAPRAGTRS